MRLLILLGFAFWMVACTPSGKQTSSKEALSSDSIQYAQGFTVQRFDTYTMVEVRDPWDSTRLLQRYLLVDRTKSGSWRITQRDDREGPGKRYCGLYFCSCGYY